jgi:hypothetical protein
MYVHMSAFMRKYAGAFWSYGTVLLQVRCSILQKLIKVSEYEMFDSLIRLFYAFYALGFIFRAFKVCEGCVLRTSNYNKAQTAT